MLFRSDDLTTVWLNGQLVVDNVKYDNYWDRNTPAATRKALPARGHLELQYHGEKLYWKNIYGKALN